LSARALASKFTATSVQGFANQRDAFAKEKILRRMQIAIGTNLRHDLRVNVANLTKNPHTAD